MDDKRIIWEYNGCRILPINCYHSTWGKAAEPRDFGDGVVRSQYWRVDFPDGSFIHVQNKKECREYIKSQRNRCPDRWDKNSPIKGCPSSPACKDSPTGQHEADYTTVIQADTEYQGIFDVSCAHCGRSGAFRLDYKTEIDW